MWHPSTSQGVPKRRALSGGQAFVGLPHPPVYQPAPRLASPQGSRASKWTCGTCVSARPAPRLRTAVCRPAPRFASGLQPAPRLADTPHASPQDCRVPARPAPRRASGLEGVQVHVRDVRVGPPRASPTRPTPRLRTAVCRPRPAPRRASGLGGVQVDAAAVEQAQLHRASLRPCGGQSGQPPLYPAAPPARRTSATCPKARLAAPQGSRASKWTLPQ
jgi:hypothetical protein